MQLRAFRKSDFRTLWRIDQSCFRPGIAYSQEELAYYITRRTAATIVAEQENDGSSAIVGFLVSQRGGKNGDLGHIVTIDVLQSARRNGVGSMLLGAAEDRLRRDGCKSVALETAVDNTAAIAFYQRHGYSIVRTIPRYYAGELDALLMEKTLPR